MRLRFAHEVFRKGLILASVTVAGAIGATSGKAASPDGGCGEAFTWATITEIRALRPSMPAGVAEGIDQNGNGALCYQELALPNYSSPHHGQLNLVDDRAPAR